MSVPNHHFGVCMACGCIQEPQGYFGDESLNKLVRDVNAVFEKESQPGVERKFLTQGMEASHYIQKANAWLALKQWLNKINEEALRDGGVDFENPKKERESAQSDYRSQWAQPAPLVFESLNNFVQNKLSGRNVPNTGYLADNDRTAHCCKECNDLMDVRGWTTHLLWAIPMREGSVLKGINPRDEHDNGGGRLIPKNAITITKVNNRTLQIPCERDGDEAHNNRGHYYTAVLSYFIHRCLRGLKTIKRNGYTGKRTQMTIRLYVILPVLGLKLLCLSKEYVQRWSSVRVETRSPHNYVGVMTLYVSYAMYMMYVCDQKVNKIPFDSFHLFYMRELVYAPKWQRSIHSTVLKYVLRSDELDDNVATTTEQVQSVVNNLIRLYEKHVACLLAVIHPKNTVYQQRLSLRKRVKVEQKWIPHFVNKHEMYKLNELHNLANAKHDSTQFSLYVMMIGIAPIAVSIRRLFCDDNPTFLEVIDRWRDECLRGEYKRMAEHNNVSIQHAQTLYQMCCVPNAILQENGLLQDGQFVSHFVQFTQAHWNQCQSDVKKLKPMSVWKSVLVLRDHGILITRRSVRKPRLPPKDSFSFYIGGCLSLPTYKCSILTECFCLRTGAQVKV